MPRAFLLVALLFFLVPKLALGAGLSADPRVPTAPIEQMVVTSVENRAIVSVWPKGAGKVYVLPVPKGVVAGSLQVLPSPGMTRLDRETALALVRARITKTAAANCSEHEEDLPPPIVLPPERPLSPRERDFQAGLPRVISGGTGPSGLWSDSPTPLGVPVVETMASNLDAEVRARGGALPPSFVPEKGAAYWVFQNLGGAMIRYRTSGVADIALVPESKGGSHETLLLVLMNADEVPFEGASHTAMFPTELEGLRAGGVYTMPPALALAEAEAALVEARYDAGAPAVVLQVMPLGYQQLTFDAGGAAGLDRFNDMFGGVAVRARVRSVPTLSLRERPLRRYAGGFFVTAQDGAGKAATLNDSHCLHVVDRTAAPAVSVRRSGAPAVAFHEVFLLQTSGPTEGSPALGAPFLPPAPQSPAVAAVVPVPPATPSASPAPAPAARIKAPLPPRGCAFGPAQPVPSGALAWLGALACLVAARRRRS